MTTAETDVTARRWVRLDQVDNVRDIGGHPAGNGQVVRWERLYRGGALDLMTERDSTRLRKLGIRTVIDLRRPESTVARVQQWCEREGLDYRNVSLSTPGTAGGHAPDDLQELLIGRLAQSLHGIATVVRLLAAAKDATPAICCCQLGRDRTGVLVALLLSLLGVDDTTVAADFAAVRRPPEAFPDGRLTRPEQMHAVLAEVRRRHGSVGEALRVYGVDTGMTRTLRLRLLEHSAPSESLALTAAIE